MKIKISGRESRAKVMIAMVDNGGNSMAGVS
jgi:hypothetical protein